jgi:hypothetical protein
MGTQMKVKYGERFKMADEFEKIQKEMPGIIRLANIPRYILTKETGISEASHYRKMRLKRYSANDIIKYLRVIANHTK